MKIGRRCELTMVKVGRSAGHVIVTGAEGPEREPQQAEIVRLRADCLAAKLQGLDRNPDDVNHLALCDRANSRNKTLNYI